MRRSRMIRRRGRPTGPRGPRGPQSRPTPRGRGRPTPRGRGPQGPSRGRPMGRGRSRRRAQAVKRPTAPTPPRGPQGPQSRATSRPPINPGQQLRNFMDTMPRVGGPQEGINLANRALPRRGGSGRAAARAAGDPRSFMNPRQAAQFNRSRGMGNVPQRPIPNRDGRMAQMQADLARAQQLRGQQSLFRAFNPNRANPSRNLPPRPMPPSNYMRQLMPAQQLQRGMGRGPMPRANIGQIQAPRPTFGQQMRPSIPRRRARIIPRRR